MATAVLPRPAETQLLGLRGIRVSVARVVLGLALLASALAPAAGSELPARSGGSSEAIASRAAVAQASAAPAVSLTQSPLVMRMGKDEFRIAFGIKSAGCAPNGCHGVIRYRVNWKAEDGTTSWGIREVGYRVLPHTGRSITVDRQYFDTAEGAHTTDVVEVTVDRITCHEGTEDRALSGRQSYTTLAGGR